MYSPKHHQIDRPELALEIIKRHDFATLISTGEDGVQISHLPFLLENMNTELVAHCARANSQWRHFKTGNQVTVIFQGPHSYISPAWYKPEPDNVPTWNYVAVHVTGEASIIEDPKESYGVVKRLSEYHENRLGTGWSLPGDGEKILAGHIRAIVAFRVRIGRIQGKFKLSQNQDGDNRRVVIQELSKLGGEPAAVAKWMDLTGQLHNV